MSAARLGASYGREKIESGRLSPRRERVSTTPATDEGGLTMGWKKLLKKFAPIALEIGTRYKVQGIADLITAVEESAIKSPHKASVDSVKILAASSEDHQADIEALRARLDALEKGQKS
jgi:hypothetical protein